MLKKLFFFLAISVLLFSCKKAADPVSPDSEKEIQFLNKSQQINSYLIEYENDEVISLIEKEGVNVDRNLPELKIAQISDLNGKNVKSLKKLRGIKSITQDKLIEWVKPTQTISAENTFTNEPFWNYQWNLRAISAPGAWKEGYTGKGVRVAVIDGGMSANHIDLDDNIDFVSSKSFVEGYEWYEEDNVFQHALHVAGIIAAEDNEFGTIGVAPGATIVALKALNAGTGTFGDVIAAIYYAATEADVDIINLSLGDFYPRNSLDAAKLNISLGHAINYAYEKGILVVAAAGNDGLDLDHSGKYVHMPSGTGNVLCVSSTAPTGYKLGGDDFDTPAHYTNYGQSYIDFAAPGGDFDLPDPAYVFDMILSPGGGTNDYYFSAGTSMAAPHVAGTAALIIEKYGRGISPSQIKTILRRSSDDLGKPGRDDFYGHGRVNAYKAVAEKTMKRFTLK